MLTEAFCSPIPHSCLSLFMFVTRPELMAALREGPEDICETYLTSGWKIYGSRFKPHKSKKFTKLWKFLLKLLLSLFLDALRPTELQITKTLEIKERGAFHIREDTEPFFHFPENRYWGESLFHFLKNYSCQSLCLDTRWNTGNKQD